MNISAARAIIESSPRTHLGLAARACLLALDACDTDRLEAGEAQMTVMNEALAAANEEAERLQKELGNERAKFDIIKRCNARLGDQFRLHQAEMNRLAKELEEARTPDPDLVRLRSLNEVCIRFCRAAAPTNPYALAMFNKAVSLLTPYLK